MNYPTNYDFAKNWKTKIVPHLDKPKVKKAYTEGVNDYLSTFPSNEKYKPNTPPADYSSNDWYCMLMERRGKIKLKELKANNQLPQEYWDIKDEIQFMHDVDEDLDEEIDELFNKKMELKEKILKPYFTWDKIKYDLESYFLSGSCHWISQTFELTLAKLVEQNEEWRVQVGEEHSTVINRNNTKVFDLLYWGLDKRLENYMFGDEIKNKDETLGGKLAYLNSLN